MLVVGNIVEDCEVLVIIGIVFIGIVCIVDTVELGKVVKGWVVGLIELDDWEEVIKLWAVVDKLILLEFIIYSDFTIKLLLFEDL